jgi:phosphoglycolate phosphatase
MAIRGIIFDKDGTLFDFQATWGAWAEDILADLFGSAAAERGRALGFHIEGRRFEQDSPIIAETTTRVAEMMLPHLPGWEMGALISHMKAKAAVTPLVHAVPLRPLLEMLHGQGLVLAVATNDDESSARRHLERAGVGDLFDMILGYDSGHGGKPAPGQILAFLARTGFAPDEVAMVGDSLHDLHAGRAAGVRTVAVLTGPAKADVLARDSDVVLPDIGHLPAWLAGA